MGRPMSDDIKDPSKAAATRLVELVNADDAIPQTLKDALAGAIASNDHEQIDSLEGTLAEWAKENATKEDSAK